MEARHRWRPHRRLTISARTQGYKVLFVGDLIRRPWPDSAPLDKIPARPASARLVRATPHGIHFAKATSRKVFGRS
jgi:hypothetical protein